MLIFFSILLTLSLNISNNNCNKGEYNVIFSSKEDKKQFLKLFDVKILKSFHKNNSHTILLKNCNKNRDIKKYFSRFDKNRYIKIEKKDNYFVKQWYLKSTGQSGVLTNSDISIEESWEQFTSGESSSIIAIIDDGFDIDHKNLSFLPGYNFLDNNSNVKYSSNDQKHGTAVSGIAAAKRGNDGIVGVCPKCSILPIKAVDNIVSEADIAESIEYAVDNGAVVINNSWGAPDDNNFYSVSSVINDAFNYAIKYGRGGLGTAIVFASGNGNQNIDSDGYASHYQTISVGAITDHNLKAYYSDYGEELDFVMPSSGYGGDRDGATSDGLFTTDISGYFGYTNGDYVEDFGGTSGAAPQLSGVIALIISKYPNISLDLIYQALKYSTDRFGFDYGEHNIYFGYGRVNVTKTFQYLKDKIDNCIFENREDICDGIDNNCDGLIDNDKSCNFCSKFKTKSKCIDDKHIQKCLNNRLIVVKCDGENICGQNSAKIIKCLPQNLNIDPNNGSNIDGCTYLKGEKKFLWLHFFLIGVIITIKRGKIWEK